MTSEMDLTTVNSAANLLLNGPEKLEIDTRIVVNNISLINNIFVVSNIQESLN